MTWAAVAVGVGGAVIGGISAQDAARRQSNTAQDAAQQSLAQYNQTRSDLQPWMKSGNMALSQLDYLMGLGSANPQVDDLQRQLAGLQAPTTAQYTANGPGTMVWSGVPGMDARSGLQGGFTRQTGAPVFNQAGYDAATQAYNQQRAALQAQLGQAQHQPTDPRFGSLTRQYSLNDFQQSPAYQFNLEQGMKALNKAAAARGNYYAPQTLQDMAKFSQGLASNEFGNAYNMWNQQNNQLYNRLYGMSGSGQSAANQTGAFGAGAQNAANELNTQAANASAAGSIGTANAIVGGANSAYNNHLMQQILQNQRGTYGSAGTYNPATDWG